LGQLLVGLQEIARFSVTDCCRRGDAFWVATHFCKRVNFDKQEVERYAPNARIYAIRAWCKKVLDDLREETSLFRGKSYFNKYEYN
jgi:hypothetical protein